MLKLNYDPVFIIKTTYVYKNMFTNSSTYFLTFALSIKIKLNRKETESSFTIPENTTPINTEHKAHKTKRFDILANFPPPNINDGRR